MRFRQSVHISDDNGSCTYFPWEFEEPTVEACLEEYYDESIESIDDVESYLRRVGGYGFIEVDGEVVMRVQ